MTERSRVDPRFAHFPTSLRERTRAVTLSSHDVPALLVHPDFRIPAPTVLYMHGRTVSKELDSGRYLRYLRAGIATCSVDLPGHGERLDPLYHEPAKTLDLLEEMLVEIDHVIEALADPAFHGAFDLDRLAIAGMSAGGMAALRRLCDPHPFRCATVEGTTGDLDALYNQTGPHARPWPVSHDPEQLAGLDPCRHLDSWEPIPLLALHAELDEVVPVGGQRGFIEKLRARYAGLGADPELVTLKTWPETGAPSEHAGFGRYAGDAKTIQTGFLSAHLRAVPIDLR